MATLAKEADAPREAGRGVNRRRFLIAAGAGAGLAIGWAVWPRRAGVTWLPGKGEEVVNSFVKIGADGRVIVAVPQAEMGQGVYSSLPQIVADELGADWNMVGVEPAPFGAAYANRGAAFTIDEAVPPAMRGFVHWAAGGAITRFDVQMTGGSTSVRGFELSLRQAGAGAREMLCRAAARRWGVDWKDCDTRDGFVVHQAKRLSFGDVARAATLEDAPRSPKLREASQRRLIGKPLTRLDLPSKTDGSARFGIDVRLPGMVYAAVNAGPIGGALRAVDKGKAPGGVQVVEGPGWVAAVADGWWQAKTALEALPIQWTLPAKPAGPWIEQGLKASLGQDGTTAESVGDAAAALGATPLVAEYTAPFLAHATLEPMNATARIADGKAEIWAPTQSTTLVRWAVAKALGIADDAVAVYPTLVGGGFGRKVETDAAVKAALIAKATGKPVQLIYSREEDMGHGMWRPPVAARFRGQVKDGRIAAWDSVIAVPNVMKSFMARNLPALASGPTPSKIALEGAVGLSYAIPALRVAWLDADNSVPLGFWRSVEHSFTGFLVESFVDELAFAAKADPGAFRLAHMGDHPRHAAVLRAALRTGGPLGAVGPGIGRGCAVHESFGSIVAQVAEVEAKPGQPLKITRVVAAIDCGRIVNPDTVRAQIEGGIVFALTAALHGRSTFENGEAAQKNFDGYPLLSLAETPAIEVIIIDSAADPGGVGEPGVPPLAPAVANAIFAASGKRLRDLPFAWT